MRMLEKRPGGRNALCSKTPILEILGKGTRDKLGLFQGKDVWILNFSLGMKSDLIRTINKLRLDGTYLKPSEISDALLKAFPTSERYGYILSDSARKCLRELDMQIDEDVFGSSRHLLNLARGLFPQIAKTHLEQCMYLLVNLISEAEPPFQDIIDSGVMPYLAEGMKRVDFESEHPASCIHIFSKLLRGKNEDHVKVILDSGFLSGLEDYYNMSANELVAVAIEDSCRSLEYIISTSVSLRDLVLSSGVLNALLIVTNNHPQASQACIELWKTIYSSYKDSSPIDISLVNIDVELMAPLLTSRNDELVEFVGSVLSLDVWNLHSSGAISMTSFSSYAAPIVDLLLSSSTTHQTVVRALRVFCLLTELDFFGSIANKLQTNRATVDSMFRLFGRLLEITPRTTEDENMVKQACKSMGYMVRMIYCKPHEKDVVQFHRIEPYISPWVKTLVKISNDGVHLTSIQNQLLLFIFNNIERGAVADEKTVSIVMNSEARLRGVTFAELVSLLDLSDSVQDVGDELKLSLQKQASDAIEDQMKKFIEICMEEEEVSAFIFHAMDHTGSTREYFILTFSFEFVNNLIL